jgi:hypothetical protein
MSRSWIPQRCIFLERAAHVMPAWAERRQRGKFRRSWEASPPSLFAQYPLVKGLHGGQQSQLPSEGPQPNVRSRGTGQSDVSKNGILLSKTESAGIEAQLVSRLPR